MCGCPTSLTEVEEDGKTHVWGTILEWNPPESVRFTWHPGAEPSDGQEVHLRFTGVEGGTEVVLTHTGWEALGDGALERRKDYDNGWTFVIDRYTRGL